MTTPHYTGSHVMHVTPIDKRRPFYVDPWRALCEHCRLEDCSRAEGDSSAVPDRNYTGCLIYDAAVVGKTAEQALQEVERGD